MELHGDLLVELLNLKLSLSELLLQEVNPILLLAELLKVLPRIKGFLLDILILLLLNQLHFLLLLILPLPFLQQRLFYFLILLNYGIQGLAVVAMFQFDCWNLLIEVNKMILHLLALHSQHLNRLFNTL